MGRPLSIKTKILRHNLGDIVEAKKLYDEYCYFLLQKYGSVDKDYDENPTRRGIEWLDIHHIMEYELDDIARRTQYQKTLEKKANWVKDNEVFYINEGNDVCWYILENENYEENYKKVVSLKESFNGGMFEIINFPYTLNNLKPFNKKDQLVYANKIEHFLLHYLIDSIRGKDFMSGGPNYLWDAAVSLSLYGFDADYLRNLQKNRNEFYSYLSVYDLTTLYKKLIDWKGWDINICSAYWINFKSAFNKFREYKVSYFKDIVALSCILRRLGGGIKFSTVMEIKELPFMYKKCLYNGKPARLVNGDIFDIDGKTVLKFSLKKIAFKQTFTIPNIVACITKNSFPPNKIKKLIIPSSVKKIEKDTFVAKYLHKDNTEKKIFEKLEIIEYKGIHSDWEKYFSKLKFDGVKIVINN